MEHNDMDQQFRNLLNEDDRPLSPEEQRTKKAIWDRLDTQPRLTVFPVWKIAAAFLFLLMAGASWMLLQKIDQQAALYADLEKEYQEIKNDLDQLKPAVVTSEPINPPVETPGVINENKSVEIIEKIIQVRDTVWLEKIQETENIRLVRDTIYIEKTVEKPVYLVRNELEKDSLIKSSSSTPGKIEFVFGKEPIEKPVKENKLFTVPSELAKKSKVSASAVITVPQN